MSAVLAAKWIPAADFKHGRGGKVPRSIILHSTCGRKLGDIETLTGAGGPVVSCHFYITRAGELYQFVREGDTAFHAGQVFDPQFGNTSSFGIEQEHIDAEDGKPGDDWPEVQILRAAQLICYLRGKYGPLPAKSHAEVAAPRGRKLDPAGYPWESLSKLVAREKAHEWELKLV